MWSPSQTQVILIQQQRSCGSEQGQEKGIIPRPLQNRRLNVVFVTELWGSRHLFRWKGTGGVHLQPCNRTQLPVKGTSHVHLAAQIKLTNGADLGVAGGMCFRFAFLFFLIAIFLLHIRNFAFIFLGFLF